ncbi:hypothetical protein [Leifsonia shinshuensis]
MPENNDTATAEWGVFSHDDGVLYRVTPPTPDRAREEAALVGARHIAVTVDDGRARANAAAHARIAALPSASESPRPPVPVLVDGAPVTADDLSIGTRVKLLYGNDIRRWWTVRAGDDRFTILTRQADFELAGTSVYTIIDWQRGVRGLCNLIGQNWGVDEPGGCEELLAALQRHVAREQRFGNADRLLTDEDGVAVEVSYRSNVRIGIAAIQHPASAGAR